MSRKKAQVAIEAVTYFDFESLKNKETWEELKTFARLWSPGL